MQYVVCVMSRALCLGDYGMAPGLCARGFWLRHLIVAVAVSASKLAAGNFVWVLWGATYSRQELFIRLLPDSVPWTWQTLGLTLLDVP